MNYFSAPCIHDLIVIYCCELPRIETLFRSGAVAVALKPSYRRDRGRDCHYNCRDGTWSDCQKMRLSRDGCNVCGVENAKVSCFSRRHDDVTE
jgi:hypothetical protein